MMNGVERSGGRAWFRRAAGVMAVLLLVATPAVAQTQAKPNAAGAATSQAAQGPEAVVRALYQHYLAAKPDSVAFDYTDPEVAKTYFDPALVKLIVADSKRETTRLDFDPFVDAQEFEIKSVDYETKTTSPREAMVTARFDNFEQSTLVTYKLARTSSGWRITDVLWAGGRGTLRKLLSGATS